MSGHSNPNMGSRSLGYTGMQIGWINSLFGHIPIAAGPLSGMIFDRLGAHLPFFISAVAALAAGAILRAGMPAGPASPARR